MGPKHTFGMFSKSTQGFRKTNSNMVPLFQRKGSIQNSVQVILQQAAKTLETITHVCVFFTGQINISKLQIMDW